MGGVRLCHLVKIVLPPGGAGKIGTKGKRLGTGTHASGHPDLSRSGIGHLPGQLCANAGILRRMLSQNVERVGFQDIGSSIYIGLVDGFDNVRVREVQILSGLQAMLLDLCAHGSVQPEHTGGKFVFNHCQSKDIEKNDPSMQYYNNFLINVLGTIESLGSVQSSFVMNEVKNSYGLVF
jgi:hypothetical protein